MIKIKKYKNLRKFIFKNFSKIILNISNWFSFWQFNLSIGFIVGFVYNQINFSYILILIVFFFLFKQVLKKKIKVIFFIFIGFILGIYNYENSISKLNEQVYSIISENSQKDTLYEGIVISKPKESEYYLSFEVRLKDKNFSVLLQTDKFLEVEYLDEIKFKALFELPIEKVKDFSYREYLKSKLVMLYSRDVQVINIQKPTKLLEKLSQDIYTYIYNFFQKNLHYPASAIIINLLTGNKNTLDKESYENFNNISISHLLVVSGYHFLMAISFVSFLNRFLPKKITLFITFLVITIYINIVGFNNIPATRAYLCALVLILSNLLGKKVNDFILLPYLIIIFLINNPFVFYNVSFLLSFAAIISLNSFLKNIYIENNENNFIKNYLLNPIIYYLKTNVLLLPILFITFNKISLVGMISNILFTPIIQILMVLSVTLIPISFINLQVVIEFINFYITFLVKIFVYISKVLSSLDISTTNNFLVFIVYFFILILLILLFELKNYIKINSKILFVIKNYIKKILNNYQINFMKNLKLNMFLIFLVILVTLFTLDIYFYYRDKDVKTIILDVGQGDSTLIINEYKKIGFIDTGKGDKVIKKIGEILPSYERTINFILLTHPDIDHIEGSVYLLQKYNVENILFNKYDSKDTLIYKHIENIIKKNKIKRYYLNKDTDFYFGGIYLDVLWPRNYTEDKIKDLNDLSISTVIEYSNVRIINFGDLSKKYEIEAILNYDKIYSLDKTINILKISHHGSKNSTSEELLNITKPVLAIISVGKNNRYNHPHTEVLNTLEQNRINIFRTDIDGNIKINITKYAVYTNRNEYKII